ncbi:MAG: hypothetical protein H6Q90_3961 [Deltaproteobacteria bacterium]|nr:hypothetical protein [Deltaproteobacteria bacterium]
MRYAWLVGSVLIAGCNLVFPLDPSTAAPCVDSPDCAPTSPAHATLFTGVDTGVGMDDRLEIRAFDTASDTWTAPFEITGDPLVGEVVWTRNVISPVERTAQIGAVLTATVSDTHLYRLDRAGDRWINTEVSSAVLPTDATRRPFDVVFTSSGTGLLVYADGGSGLRFCTYEAGTWTCASSDVLDGLAGANEVVWIRLASNPARDEVAMAYVSRGAQFGVIVWNGTEWDKLSLSTPALGTALNQTEFEAVAIRYSVDGNTLYAVWEPADTASNLFFASYVNGFGWTNFGQFNIDYCCVLWSELDLVADRNTGNLLLGGLRGDFLFGALYDGTTWTTASTEVTRNDEMRSSDAFFLVASSGSVPVTVSEIHLGGMLAARTRIAGTWESIGDIALRDGGRKVRAVSCAPYPGDAKAVCVLADDKGRLYGATFSLSAGWAFTSNGRPLIDAVSTTITKAFSVDVQNVP